MTVLEAQRGRRGRRLPAEPFTTWLHRLGTTPSAVGRRIGMDPRIVRAFWYGERRYVLEDTVERAMRAAGLRPDADQLYEGYIMATAAEHARRNKRNRSPIGHGRETNGQGREKIRLSTRGPEMTIDLANKVLFDMRDALRVTTQTMECYLLGQKDDEDLRLRIQADRRLLAEVNSALIEGKDLPSPTPLPRAPRKSKDRSKK